MVAATPTIIGTPKDPALTFRDSLNTPRRTPGAPGPETALRLPLGTRFAFPEEGKDDAPNAERSEKKSNDGSITARSEKKSNDGLTTEKNEVKATTVITSGRKWSFKTILCGGFTIFCLAYIVAGTSVWGYCNNNGCSEATRNHMKSLFAVGGGISGIGLLGVFFTCIYQRCCSPQRYLSNIEQFP